MHFYLISLLVILGTTLLTWIPKLTSTSAGILDIIPNIVKTAKETTFGPSGNGLGIFAFAFFLYAVLQSQSVQSLFASKKKWLQKNGSFTVAIITIFASLLASGLLWYDEFVHFYPLVIPLLLAMGFDTFSALLCLYGGASAGLMGIISSDMWSGNIGSIVNSDKEVQKRAFTFSNSDGFAFRVICWLTFTTIIVLFNIWYCNKVFRRSQEKREISEINNLEETKAAPKLTKNRKFILFLFGFFVASSVVGSVVPKIAKRWKESELIIPEKITSNYEEKEEYIKLGEVGHENEKMPLAKVKKEEKEKAWGVFGKWGDVQIYSWFIIGAILICLLSKQSIPQVLVKSIQQTIPLLLAYILMRTPGTIARNYGLGKNLNLSSLGVMKNAKFWALPLAFLIPFIINFLIPHSPIMIISILSPLLLRISKNTLIYGVIAIVMGWMLSDTFSPMNGILQVTLEKNKLTYKQYLKKTWLLGLIMFFITLGLILMAAWFTKY